MKNSDEIDAWLFEHAVIQGHTCVGIKENINGEWVNVAWRDIQTGEKIECNFGDPINDY